MAKLTLSIDEDVVRRAKEFADAHDTSVSALVERLLDGVTRLPTDEADAPALRRFRGILKGSPEVGVEEYRRYLVDKYR